MSESPVWKPIDTMAHGILVYESIASNRLIMSVCKSVTYMKYLTGAISNSLTKMTNDTSMYSSDS